MEKIVTIRNNAKFIKKTSSHEPLIERLPKARIIEGLPLGNLGGNAIVCKGIVEGICNPVALKISKCSSLFDIHKLKEEFEMSRRISGMVPNVASYHSMVSMKEYPGYPAFAMEIVVGYPILDRNIDLMDPGRFRNIIGRPAVGQLKESLETASRKGWIMEDIQYFVLLEDQTLNGRSHRKGDIILFDFADWQRIFNGRGSDFEMAVKQLERLVERIEKIK